MWLPICSVAIALRALGLFIRQRQRSVFEPSISTDSPHDSSQTQP